jgi:hypothetical protein
MCFAIQDTKFTASEAAKAKKECHQIAAIFLTKKNCCLKFRSVHYWQHGTNHGKNILQQQHKAVF